MHLTLLSTLLLIIPLASCLPLNKVTIGAFNIRIFGATKAKKNDVINNVQKIMLGYDIVLVQEIRDKSQKSMDILLNNLNSVPGVKFSYFRSDRLGRSRSKEQYAFYYRSDKLDITGSHQYSDPNDDFEREPFSVLLRVPLPNNDTLDLALVGLHAKPTAAVDEIDHLDEVCDEVSTKLFTKNIVIMGDLNAGCRYANDEKLAETEVFSDTRNFQSLLDSNTDTTTYTTTSCAYDRIIVSGRELRSKTLTAEVDRFDTKLGLSYTETKAVSDHYPVKLTVVLIIVSGRELRSKTLTAEVDRFDTKLGLSYTETKAVSDHYPVKLTVVL